jgi:hypothetical protein
MKSLPIVSLRQRNSSALHGAMWTVPTGFGQSGCDSSLSLFGDGMTLAARP